MIVTIYRGAKDETPILTEDLSWPELVHEVTDALALEAPKLQMLAVSPHRLRVGATRLLANVDAVTFLAIDVDAGDPDAVREALEYAGWQALVYESPSSTDDAPRFRVLAPTSRELRVDECRASRFAFAEALGLAPGCGVEGAKDAAKIFFVGTLPRSRARAWFATEGEPVDVDALLAQGHAAEWERAAKAPAAKGAAPTDALERAEAAARLAAPAMQDGTAGVTCLKAALAIATLTKDEAATLDVLARVYGPRCLPVWTDATGELTHKASEAHRLIARDEAALKGVSSALERHRARAADDGAAWAHAPDEAPVGTPVLLRSREGKTVLLWEGDDRGLRPIAETVLRCRVRELGLQTLVPLTHGGKALKAATILEDATTYGETRYDFARTVTEYDAAGEGCVTVGFAPRGPAPRFDADADAWLRALGGAAYPRLEAWLASCAQRNIHRIAACLVVIGEPDVGKSLVGVCAAATWAAMPPPMGLVVQQFNGQLLDCPVCVDEEAQLFGSRRLSTKAFRDLAQATARGIERKYAERVQLVGAQRYVVPCNDLSDIKFTDLGGGDVVQALADRLLVIDAKPRTAACKGSLARLRVEGAWTVDVTRIAAHMAWLGETVALPVERFVGAGGADGARGAVLRGHVREHEELFDTLEVWLERDKVASAGPWYARDGALYVSRHELAAMLEQRGRGWDLPRVTEALEPFGRGAARVRVGGANAIRVWRVDADALAEAGACEGGALGARLRG